MNKKHKRSRSSSSPPHITDSDDDSSKRKSCKLVRGRDERHHRRKHHKHNRNRNENSSSEDEGRKFKYKSQEKNISQTNEFLGVKVKDEPVSDGEQERKFRGRHSEARERDEYHLSRRPIKGEVQSDKEPDWGKKDIKTEKKEPPKNNAKPDFGLSGKLTEDANTYNGVVIKYSEPPEARKPKRRWRLYPFKGEHALPVLHIHRQSAYLLGRDRKVADIPIDHPSCSKQHAALQYRLVPFTREDGSKGRQVKLYVIDLESANGTYLNNNKVEPRKYYELKERDVIKFGYSLRDYVLLHEHSKDSENDDDVNNDD